MSGPNQVGVGAAKGIVEQLGAGPGDVDLFPSARYLIARDPARAIRRGRNLFQRKFKHAEGAGPRTRDGNGPPEQEDPSAPIFENSVGAGLSDSCALCHGRPRGSAGAGGNVFTRPDSRDAPHLFGLGIQEQLADEITAELREIRDNAAAAGCTPGGSGSPLNADNASLWNVQSGSGGTIANAPGGGINVTVGSGWTIVRSAVVGPLSGINSTLQFALNIPAGAPTWGIVNAVIVAPASGITWGQLTQIPLSSLNIGGLNQISLAIPANLRAALNGDPNASINIIVQGNPGQVFRFDNIVVAQQQPGSTGGCPRVVPLIAKGVNYGSLSVDQAGVINTSGVRGVNPDLRVRPFFAEGSTITIREFSVGAFNAEMGIQIHDPVIVEAAAGGTVVTPSGFVMDGSIDTFETAPTPEATDPDGTEPNAPGLPEDAGIALIDFMEFYLLNYFKPGHYLQTTNTNAGRALFNQVGCNSCHIANFTVDSDRRVADVETLHRLAVPSAQRPPAGVFNNLFAIASTRFQAVPDSEDEFGFPIIEPQGQSFLVEDIFTDFKRHDLGAALHERNFDNTIQNEFMTEALWGVGTTAPYGHDGRSINLMEIIERHGGEATNARTAFRGLSTAQKNLVFEFLNVLVLFPPDDTASNLNVPGDIDPTNPEFPTRAHGSIRLPTLFTIAALGPE
ncbi:MAG TPA: di-heme oxidoredictase family protein [Polyangiaceae bacterium]